MISYIKKVVYIIFIFFAFNNISFWQDYEYYGNYQEQEDQRLQNQAYEEYQKNQEWYEEQENQEMQYRTDEEYQRNQESIDQLNQQNQEFNEEFQNNLRLHQEQISLEDQQRYYQNQWISYSIPESVYTIKKNISKKEKSEYQQAEQEYLTESVSICIKQRKEVYEDNVNRGKEDYSNYFFVINISIFFLFWWMFVPALFALLSYWLNKYILNRDKELRIDWDNSMRNALVVYVAIVVISSIWYFYKLSTVESFVNNSLPTIQECINKITPFNYDSYRYDQNREAYKYDTIFNSIQYGPIDLFSSEE